MKRHEIIPELIEAIAEAEGCSPHELEFTLYDYVDTSTIRSLWASKKTDWELTFTIPDHTVVLRGSGEILIDDTVVRELTPPASKK